MHIQITKAVSVLAFGAMMAVGVQAAVEYVVNRNLPVSFWMIYVSVEPINEEFKVGETVYFKSRSTRFKSTYVSWPDVLWCAPEDEPDRFRYIGTQYATPVVPVTPGYSGMGFPLPGADPKFKVTLGEWQWDGPTPITPSICYLEPKPLIHPSPGVIRKVPVPVSSTFRIVSHE